MKIYIMESELDKFAYLEFDEKYDDYFEEHLKLNGISRKAVWKPFEVKFKTKKKRSDFQNFYLNDYAISKKAIDVLEHLFPQSTELLPLINDEKELYALNICSSIDCLDHEKTGAKRRADQSIINIYKYVFKTELLDNIHLFKLPHRDNFYFVSEKFKNTVEQNKLTGFIFDLVFDTEQDIYYDPIYNMVVEAYQKK
jgi:hypothetical protein